MACPAVVVQRCGAVACGLGSPEHIDLGQHGASSCKPLQLRTCGIACNCRAVVASTWCSIHECHGWRKSKSLSSTSAPTASAFSVCTVRVPCLHLFCTASAMQHKGDCRARALSWMCSITKEEYTIPFGACVWSTGVAMHPLLKHVGRSASCHCLHAVTCRRRHVEYCLCKMCLIGGCCSNNRHVLR